MEWCGGDDFSFLFYSQSDPMCMHNKRGHSASKKKIKKIDHLISTEVFKIRNTRIFFFFFSNFCKVTKGGMCAKLEVCLWVGEKKRKTSGMGGGNNIRLQ